MKNNEFNELNAKRIELQNLMHEFQFMELNKEKDLRTLKFIMQEIRVLMEDIFYMECINFIGGKK